MLDLASRTPPQSLTGLAVYRIKALFGAGKHDAEWMSELLVARDRRAAPPTFAGDGLYFTGADYDPGFRLPATRRDVMLAH